MATGIHVTTNATQTLTNKTMSGASNTFTSIPSSALPDFILSSTYFSGVGSVGDPLVPIIDTTITNGSVVPITSNAVFDALALKANLASPTFTGNLTTPTIKITGGAPGSGKVLTSDADGDATWETAGGGSGDMVLASVQTVTGAKTFGTIGGAVGKFILAGSTSGSTILNAAAVAGSGTVTLPTTGTLSTLGGAETFTGLKTFAPSSGTDALIFTGDITPTANNLYDIGNSTTKLKKGYFANADIGNVISSYYIASTSDHINFFQTDAATQTARISGSNGEVIFQTGGTYTATPSAQVAINSTTKGFLPPRVTTAQRTAISSPADGLIVYDTDLDKQYTYNNGAWFASATITGTETLTNKTLTSPVINTPTGIVKGDVGLGNVDNTSNATERAATATLTNKRWTARVGSTTSSATPTINTDNTDIYKLTAQTEAITSFTTNLTGTPVDGDILEIQITGTAARALTFGASFVSSTVTIPTTTVTTATLSVVFQYFTTSSYGNNKWVCVNSF